MATAYRATFRSVTHGKSIERYFTTILKACIQLNEWHQLSKVKGGLTGYRGIYNRIKDGKVNAHVDIIEWEQLIHIFQIDEIRIE